MKDKESIITLVGFLGAGKTTLLRKLTRLYMENGWNPYIILNDYENAQIDAQLFTDQLNSNTIKALSGSCICCSGLHQLRDFVNDIPIRPNGVTFIEANGTTDACSLAGFMGTGLDERFFPPMQVAVVDVKNWQKRGEHNELEASQVLLSALVVLNHTESISADRVKEVTEQISKINPQAQIITSDSLDAMALLELTPNVQSIDKIAHSKFHWASCSVDLPSLPNKESIDFLCKQIPESILRVKGCLQLEGEDSFSYFERTPGGEVSIREVFGLPTTGAKLLSIGLGSKESILNDAIAKTLKAIKAELI